MSDRKGNFYVVGNEVDRQNYKIDIDKPYIIVCGNIGIEKSVYINVMRKFNSEIQYLEVQNIRTVDRYVRKMAKKVIEIRRIY